MITDKKLNSIRNPESSLHGAVIDKLLDEDKEYRENWLRDLLQHGCVSGLVGGLIYYNETTAFYNIHKDEIWEMAVEQAEDLGHKNALEMIGSFQGMETVSDCTTFENLMAWYGFEEMARKIANELKLEI
uniref:DUF7222 domain-containing protein n=1 Tax=viral metagenome TaxID=1070528 RepID=A0A6M3L8J5_9ZZZZ